jgi:hypothetical protein
MKSRIGATAISSIHLRRTVPDAYAASISASRKDKPHRQLELIAARRSCKSFARTLRDLQAIPPFSAALLTGIDRRVGSTQGGGAETAHVHDPDGGRPRSRRRADAPALNSPLERAALTASTRTAEGIRRTQFGRARRPRVRDGGHGSCGHTRRLLRRRGRATPSACASFAPGACSRLPSRERNHARRDARAPGAGPGAGNVTAASRPATYFIADPNTFSVIVAILAGIAGVLSLTTERSVRLQASSSR